MNHSPPLAAAAVTPHAAATSAAPQQAVPLRTSRIVDAPIRLFHALFALSFLGAYLTAEGESMRLLHVTLGYTMVGLLGFRLVYGCIGPRHVRLSLLWRKLGTAAAWWDSVRQVAQGVPGMSVNWRQGHNFVLALAVVVLLLLVVPVAGSGYASYNDWGDAWAFVHDGVGNALLCVVLVHTGVVVVMGLLRRKNLAMQMVHGRSGQFGPDLVRRNHAGLAALVLVAVLAYWAWMWQQSPTGLVSAQALSDLLTHYEHGGDD
jgi:cytochrome b